MSTASEKKFLDRTNPPNIITLVLLAGVSALSMNIFLPSLPSMTEHFETDYSVMQLSIAVYLLVNAALQIVIGPISDQLGRRPVILGGMAIFLIATIGCIYAQNVTMFLIFRMMQAAVVAAMVLSRAVVRDMVPADQAASMIGYVTMGMTIVPMLGPLIGGTLDQMFGWQASFWMLFAVGALILLLTWMDLGETKASSGLTMAQQMREIPELLRSQRFWGYSLACGFSSGAFFAYLGGAPFVATTIFEMSPSKMGLYFSAPALGYFAGNFLSGRYSARAGVNKMVMIGSSIAVFGVFLSLTTFPLGFKSAESFFGLMIFVGLGNGLCIPNATSGAMSVRPSLAGTASGLAGAIMIGGGAGLSALAGVVLTPGSGPYPLLWLMFATTLMGVLAILTVIRRERQLNR